MENDSNYNCDFVGKGMGRNGPLVQLHGLLPGSKQIRNVIGLGAIIDQALLRLHVIRFRLDPVAGPLSDLVRVGRPFGPDGRLREGDGLVVGPRALGGGGRAGAAAGRRRTGRLARRRTNNGGR
jgi:hypothetical protein